MRRFFLICLCILTSCGSHTKNIPSENALPSPPHSELSNHQIALGVDDSVAIDTSSINEIISSMKRLHALPNKSAYRPHLEELSTRCFQKLLESNDPEIVMMTMQAAALCHHPLSQDIALSLIRSSYPVIQLAAIQALSSLYSTEADCMLVEALRSDYPVIRLEAAWHIAHKKIPQAFFHIDTLMYKLPPELLPYMPELFAAEGSLLSMLRLKQLLLDADERIVVETLLAIGKYNLVSFGDTLPYFESHSPAVLEALAFALQNVATDSARDRLKALAQHSDPYVSLQAYLSLIAQGDLSYQKCIERFAEQGNIFALFSLGSCPQALTLEHAFSDKCCCLNLTVSQLMKRNSASVPFLKKMLTLPDSEFISVGYSPGRALFCWETKPADVCAEDVLPSLAEESLRAKEYLLSLSIELEENEFLDIASYVFQQGIFDLYPCLMQLLENKQSDASIELLRQESMRVGAPYNRAFATLGLIKIQKQFKEKDLIPILELSREKKAQSWRFPVPWMDNAVSDDRIPFNQTTMLAHLYIGTLTTLAENGSPEAVAILIDELERAPQKYLPFVISALLYATL